MSTLAKAFVVVILILAVFFVSSTLTVLSLQTDLKEKHDAKAAELQQTKTELENTQQRMKEELEKKDKEIVKKQDAINDLTEVLNTAQMALKDLKTVNAERANLLKELNVSLARVTAEVTQQTALNKDLHDQVAKASSDLLEAMKKRDAALSENTKLKDESETLIARVKQLVEELTTAEQEATLYKTYFGPLPLAAERRRTLKELEGKVLEVTVLRDKQGKEAGVLALISLGRDDGLQKGDQLSIVRGGSRYIVDVLVDEVLLDQSVVKVIPEMQRPGEQVKKGDEVTTRFLK